MAHDLLNWEESVPRKGFRIPQRAPKRSVHCTVSDSRPSPHQQSQALSMRVGDTEGQ